MAKQKDMAAALPEEAAYVYVGPGVQGVAQTGTIVTGTREEALQRFSRLLEKCPEAAMLIVKDTELAAARAKLKKGGNAIAAAFAAVAKTAR